MRHICKFKQSCCFFFFCIVWVCFIYSVSSEVGCGRPEAASVPVRIYFFFFVVDVCSLLFRFSCPGGNDVKRPGPRCHAGRDIFLLIFLFYVPHRMQSPLPRMCARSFLLKTSDGAAEAWGGGDAYLCACNVLHMWAGDVYKWEGWRLLLLLFFVVRILLLSKQRMMMIQMNCVAQKRGESRQSVSLFLPLPLRCFLWTF